MSARFHVPMLVLNTALAAGLAAWWLSPLSNRVWQAPVAQPSNLTEVAQSLLVDNPALGDGFPAVLERPVFLASRQAPAPAPAAAASAPEPAIALSSVKISGIVQSAGVLQVLAEVEGQPRNLKPGDKVGEWQLSAVDDRTVRFVKGDETQELKLPHIHTPEPGTTDEVKQLRGSDASQEKTQVRAGGSAAGSQSPQQVRQSKASEAPRQPSQRRGQPQQSDDSASAPRPARAEPRELPGVSFGAPSPRRNAP